MKTILTTLLAATLALAACKKSDTATKGDKADPVATAPASAAKATEPRTAVPAAAPAATAAALASDDEYVTRGTAAVEKMTAAFQADVQDCNKLAGDLEAIQAADGGALDAYDHAHPDVKQKFKQASQDQLKAFTAAATTALTACKDNQKLADAISKMN